VAFGTGTGTLVGSQEITLETGLRDMTREETLVRSRSVVARVVAGETLIVPVRGKVGDLASIYSFNGTGTLIWKLLESPRTVAQLAEAVAQEYDVEPAQAERDVASFVGEMKSVGLVEVSAASFVEWPETEQARPVGREELAAAGAD
jgi:Coenzyme PQQ synthesis protein D (PqqD)